MSEPPREGTRTEGGESKHPCSLGSEHHFEFKKGLHPAEREKELSGVPKLKAEIPELSCF